MRFPATPGWVSLPLVVGAPRHSWLRAPGCGSPPLLVGVCWRRWCVVACHSWLRVLVAVPRHSWQGYAGRGGGCFRGWGFSVLCVLVARRVRVVSVLVSVVCVRGVCVGGGAGVGVPSACVCVCVCVCVVCWLRAVAGPCFLRLLLGCGWCVLWLVPRHSWRRFLCATTRHSWLGFAAGGGGCSSPLLAEGPGCGSPPLLAGVCRRWWCAAPRHSWRGPAGCGGVFRWWGCPLFCVSVVCVAACGGPAVLSVAFFLVSTLLVVWCGGAAWVCLPRALVFVVVFVWCAGGPWFVVPAPFGSGLRLVFVWVWLVCGVGPPPLLAEGLGCGGPPLLVRVRRPPPGAVVGPSPLLAEGPWRGSPPLLAGVHWRWWGGPASHS